MGTRAPLLLHRSQRWKCEGRHFRQDHSDGELAPFRQRTFRNGLWIRTPRPLRSEGQHSILSESHSTAVLKTPSRNQKIKIPCWSASRLISNLDVGGFPS